MKSNRPRKRNSDSSPRIVGVQDSGGSSDKIYNSCIDLLGREGALGGALADIGGGRGSFSLRVKGFFDTISLLDYSMPDLNGINTKAANLNELWPLPSDAFDVAVALEVIEHLENPRHFFREIIRITKCGGLVIVSTPNQLSIFSKLCFLIRSQHQQFQDACYPAHITAVLPKDFERISFELGQPDFFFSYTSLTRIPGTKMNFQEIVPWAKGRPFSDNILFAIRVRKPSS